MSNSIKNKAVCDIRLPNVILPGVIVSRPILKVPNTRKPNIIIREK